MNLLRFIQNIAKWNDVLSHYQKCTEEELNDQLFEFDSEERKLKTKVLTQWLLNSYQNRIEIWYAGKKVHKTIIAKIISGGLLFF